MSSNRSDYGLLPRRVVAATRRGQGPAGFCNVLLIRERRGLLVLYPHAVPDLAIELDDAAAAALRDAITDLLG
jgi:hypothetical protein